MRRVLLDQGLAPLAAEILRQYGFMQSARKPEVQFSATRLDQSRVNYPSNAESKCIAR